MKYHIFSGLYVDTGDFQTNTGIGLWSNFNDASGLYTVNQELHFVIDTPNYANNSSIGGGLQIDNEMAGSAPIQAGTNTQFQGPCNGFPSNFPIGKKVKSIPFLYISFSKLKDTFPNEREFNGAL